MPVAHPPPELVETPRLRLRKVRLSDAPAMFATFESDPRVTRFLVMPTQATIGDAERHAVERVAEWNDDRRWTYAITLTAAGDDQAVGRIALKNNPEGVSVGYALAYRLFGRGIASEAVQALCPIGHALSDYFFARVDAENAASIRVLEKCGFEQQELRPQSLVMPNIGPEPRDCFIYVKPQP
jgi:ribosomal-protein-alanine N-acetyltransferase